MTTTIVVRMQPDQPTQAAWEIAASFERYVGVDSVEVLVDGPPRQQPKSTRLRPRDIPRDFEVRPIVNLAKARDAVTCFTCGLSWDDAIPTSYTPAPSARCPFEYFHKET